MLEPASEASLLADELGTDDVNALAELDDTGCTTLELLDLAKEADTGCDDDFGPIEVTAIVCASDVLCEMLIDDGFELVCEEDTAWLARTDEE